MVQQNRLAQEKNGGANPKENLEAPLNEPNVPEVTNRGRWHGWQVQKESLKPPQRKQSNVEFVMIEMVRKNW